MAWPADFLRRFRPAGTPGPAARAGVPVDRVAEAADELEPVLALLAGAESAAADIREQARQDALELGDQARARAAGLVAEARGRAEAERADAVALARGRAHADSARLADEARRQAAARRALAEQRLPGYVARVVRMVQAAGEEPAGLGAEDAR
jgi:vacuolar-type H+-ATPase subunit H